MSPQTAESIKVLEENVNAVLLGKPTTVRLALVSMLAQGHILIEDAPGVGKTVLAKSLARSLNCEFRRLQCTPDLLPSDIVGSSIFLPNKGTFEFRKGPVFTNILLADEINRATPRTQSALLEAMSEGQVSIEGETHILPFPFLVIATQNPFEFEGTYPLPENQLDRFLVCLEIGYPDRSIERDVLKSHRVGEPFEQLKPVLSGEKFVELQSQVREVKVDDALSDYLLDIVEATRAHDEIELGISTRGALAYYRAVQAWALVDGRDYVIPDDIKTLAGPVMAHRLICRGLIQEGQRRRSMDLVRRILDNIRVPY
ncbi:MAG: MoxR family ATPase [Planctomycetales bacterium]